MTGTARGFADEAGLTPAPDVTIPPKGTRLSTTGTISLSGESFGLLCELSQGRLGGILVFSRNGVTSTCPASVVGWTMNRLR